MRTQTKTEVGDLDPAVRNPGMWVPDLLFLQLINNFSKEHDFILKMVKM